MMSSCGLAMAETAVCEAWTILSVLMQDLQLLMIDEDYLSEAAFRSSKETDKVGLYVICEQGSLSPMFP